MVLISFILEAFASIIKREFLNCQLKCSGLDPKEVNVAFYHHHVFFCTNEKLPGKKCCHQGNPLHWREYCKKKLRKLSKHGKGAIRINVSGCLGRCQEGPLLVIYPEGIWYRYRTQSDIDRIIEEHLLKGNPVDDLRLPNNID